MGAMPIRTQEAREMNHYLLSIYQPDGDPPPSVDMERIMREVNAVNQEMKAAGAWVFSDGLCPPSMAAVVRVHDHEALITDGPYLESKEHVGGFYLIRAEDRTAEVAWGRKLANATTLPIEVRPIRGHAEGR
jgi:hypothetical protein